VTRFIVVRHGETAWNREARIQGHGDSPLTEAGLAQAHAIARRLAGEPLDALVSSDLGRALQTAQRVSAATGRAVRSDARFRERSFGAAEGLTYAELQERFPDTFAHGLADFRVPEGETRREFYGRIGAAFEALAREEAGRCVAVVCHGGVLSALYRHVHRIPAEEVLKVEIPNGAYNCVARDASGWTIEAWADVGHLAEDTGNNGSPRGSILARMS
jgi:2,3-bisphosphoglycerate-dependent phosphoglycerate mutase